jgi:hypothetical protein
VLYGGLALLLGNSDGARVAAFATSPELRLAIAALMWAFSIAVFFVDFGDLRKKLKVVAARDTPDERHAAQGGDASADLKDTIAFAAAHLTPKPHGRTRPRAIGTA